MRAHHILKQEKKEHNFSVQEDKSKQPLIPPKELHVCMGLNACKGHDYFGTNDCAGTGQCATVQHVCHTVNDCRGQGGCGLFGTAEELCHPGENDCAFQGSCGSPIPRSRYIAQGPNKGTSVWLLARKRFEDRMEKAGRTVGPSPMENGPTLEWLGENVGWTSSCGNSGEKFCSFTNAEDARERRKEFVKKSIEHLPKTIENCQD